MKTIIENLFGVYTVTTYTVGSDTIVPSGVAALDVPFICGFILFVVSMYCVFKIVGGILTNVIGHK